MHATDDHSRHDPGEAGVCAAVFASTLVLCTIRWVVLDILTFVGAPQPTSRIGMLLALSFVVGVAMLLLRASRHAFAVARTVAGPVLLAVWFLLKNSSDPTPVTILMGLALLPFGSIFLCAAGPAKHLWKLLLAAATGFIAGLLVTRPLLRAAGPEATWFICTAIISAASLIDRPSRRTAWRWVLGFLTAAVAVMLAAVQIKLEPMRLQWHLPVPRILDGHSTDTR